MKQRTKGLIAGSVALTALATSSISYYEGRSLRAYQDIVNIWTICDGKTKGVKPAMSSRRLSAMQCWPPGRWVQIPIGSVPG